MLFELLFLLLSFICFFSFYYKGKTIGNIFNNFDKNNLEDIEIPLNGGVFLLLLNNIALLNEILSNKNQTTIVVILILAINIFFIIGLVDDIKNLKPITRLIISTLIVYLLINEVSYLQIREIRFSFITIDTKILAIFFTIVCILTAQFSINMIDGIDGLAISYVLFVIIFIYIKTNGGLNNLYLLSIISLVFALILNLKRKLFLGDSGIYLITVYLSLIIIYQYNIYQLDINQILCLLSYPFIEMIRLILMRLLKKQNPMLGDRNHLHHLLTNKLGKKISLFISILLIAIPIMIQQYINIFIIPIIIQLIIYITFLRFSLHKSLK